jgi:hypothetical protein
VVSGGANSISWRVCMLFRVPKVAYPVEDLTTGAKILFRILPGIIARFARLGVMVTVETEVMFVMGIAEDNLAEGWKEPEDVFFVSFCWYHRVILHAVEGIVTCCIC